MTTITPVLLCGGSGARLWPVSRRSFPKQFTALIGAQTLFQASASRLTGDGFAAPLVVTGADFRFIVAEQLDQIALTPGAIVIEPSPRNTAPAVLAAALLLADDDPATPMLVAPSDHVFRDSAGFRAAVMQGLPAALAGQIVTFGIAPTRPETGYGWLEVGGNAGHDGVVPLQRFVEKPDHAEALRMQTAGGYLWNAGIFLGTAQSFIDAFARHAADYLPNVTQALELAQTDLGFLRLDAGAWNALPDQSIDYAVMEKAGNLSVVPYDGGWSDLGGWDAVWREQQAAGDTDGKSGVGSTGGTHLAHGVVADARSTALDCHNVLLRSEAEDMQIVGIGLRDLLVVATGDAVLVAGMDRAQEVRRAVDALKAKGAPQATAFRRDHRPWGWFETLALAERFRVKRITVRPGASLSLQSHVHRSEHWIVVSGTALVTVDAQETLLTENQSVYVPLGSVHRLENPGRVPMVLIEVQTGIYLGEDDIIRYDDRYARS